MVRNIGTKLDTLFTNNVKESSEFKIDWNLLLFIFPRSRLPTPELPMYVPQCIPKQFVQYKQY